VGLERELNQVLSTACGELMGSPPRVEHFARLFDRTHESGFYTQSSGVRGQGEQPTWSPNPAYIDSLEEIWVGAAECLDRRGLALDKSLRELFFTSHEYHDRENDHRRVFHGHLVERETGVPRTFFMLTVPHSHDGFRYVEAPVIRLSEELLPEELLPEELS
jgi:hypothetical protein